MMAAAAREDAAGRRRQQQQDSVPRNRFSLELVDVLLDERCFFRLNQPVVTVGMFGENTWNLPLELLLGSELSERLRACWEDEEWAQRPLLELTFDAEMCTWGAVRAYLLDQDAWMNTTYTREFVLKPGVKVDIDLGVSLYDEADCRLNYDTEGFGIFSVILHDANQPAAASTFIEKLASLPPVALGMIAGHLKPLECIHILCPLSPSIPQKLRAVGVQWSELIFSGIRGEYERLEATDAVQTLLDCLRALKLVAAGDKFKSLYLGDGHAGYEGPDYAWRMSDNVNEQVFRAAKKLIFAPKLQELWLAASWLRFVDPTAPLPNSLQTVYIGHEGCKTDGICVDLWAHLSRLNLPVAAGLYVCLADDDDKPYCSKKPQRVQYPIIGAGFLLPNVVSVHLSSCMHSPFLPPKALPNLQKLELKCTTSFNQRPTISSSSGCDSLGFNHPSTMSPNSRQCHVSDTLRASSFPKLRTAKMRLDSQQSMPSIVDALATAAPNLEVLELHLPIDRADAGHKSNTGDRQQESSLLPPFTAAVRPLRRFLELQRLKMNFTDPVPVGELESLLNFCLALLGTEISIVELDCVDCSDVLSKRVQNISALLKQSGKDVVLIRRAPERIDLPFAGMCGQKGLTDYKVIVHSRKLKLSKDDVL